MNPARNNIVIFIGEDWKQEYQIQDDSENPINLTGWTVAAQIRAGKSSDTDLLAEFSVDTSDLATGKFVISLTDTQTSEISVSKGYYDIRLTDPSDFSESYIIGDVVFREAITA